MNKSLQVILLALLATACSEEIDMTEQTSETITYSDAELEKIAYGCDYYLDEGEDEKVETRATDEYLEFISESLKQTQSSLKAKPIEPKTYVGVIKRETCGKYATIHVHFDCEDKHNKSSWTKGSTGAWWVDGKGNVKMDFCCVPFKDFPVNVGDYALLRLSSAPLRFDNDYNYSDSTFILRVHMDAEDKHEDTSMSLVRGTKGSEADIQSEMVVAESTVHNWVRVTSRGDLDLELICMHRYHSEKSKVAWPDFGFDYNVFGYNFDDGGNKAENGWVIADTEDKNNGDRIELVLQTNNGKEVELGNISILDEYHKKKLPARVVEYYSPGIRFNMRKVNRGKYPL